MSPMAAAAASATGGGETFETLSRKLVDMEEKMGEMRKKIKDLEDEAEKVRGELDSLRDSVEEGEWARDSLERQIKERKKVDEEVEKMKKELEGMRKEREEEAAREASERQALKAMVDTLKEQVAGGARTSGSPEQSGTEPVQVRRQRCVIFVDSNGRDATEDSVKTHIPRDQRKNFEIEVVPAYTLAEAAYLIRKKKVNITGARVIIDNLTNDVRGTKQKTAASPEDLVRRVDELLGELFTAESATVCQIKPMRHMDVSPYNYILDDYLRFWGIFACPTQIRMEDLRGGFHIKHQADSVLDKTYACAILRVPVPCPTPAENFVPEFVRMQFQKDWPLPGGRIVASEGYRGNHGWW